MQSYEIFERSYGKVQRKNKQNFASPAENLTNGFNEFSGLCMCQKSVILILNSWKIGILNMLQKQDWLMMSDIHMENFLFHIGTFPNMQK